MKRVLSGIGALVVLVLMVLLQSAWLDGKEASVRLTSEARHLISTGQGPQALGDARVAALLAYIDPSLMQHIGITWGGPETVTQRLALLEQEQTYAVLTKARRNFYALALDQEVPKMAQLALFMNRVKVTTPAGQDVKGVFAASRMIYGKPVDELSGGEFIELLESIGGAPQPAAQRPLSMNIVTLDQNY